VKKTAFLILNLAGALLFAYFAWLQHDDSDPAIYEHASVIDAWSWIVFYALISLAFVLALFRRFSWILFGVAIAFCLYEMITTGGGVIANLNSAEGFTMTKSSMNPSHPQVELSREFFGAVISLVAIGFLILQKRQRV